ncbi:MAG: hypothetical protein HQ574_06950 [Chloroflexi bacterium]|nr:hypothetical protein [Chloroflexota bacterium]
MKRKILRVCFGLVLLLAGCAVDSPVGEPVPESQFEPSPTPDETQIAEDRFPTTGVIYQWGSTGEASSEFANPEWSASQAAGKPDAPGCGDYQLAWASAASDSIDTLELTYPTAVYPLEIVIYESFNPDQVAKVEVFNPETGGYYTVLQKNPIQVDRPCPYELVILVDGIQFKTNLIRITVDQSQLGLGWNEIDAVQLIGSVLEP